MPDDIEQLTTAMARGDRAAVAAFYRRYFDLMHRAAVAATGRRQDEQFCLDVVHDAVLRVVRTIRPVAGGEGQLVAWLRMVVHSAAYDLFRKEQRRTRREQSAVSAAREVAKHVGGVELAEQIAWLRGELERLDPRLVELIELRYERQWTLAAIGARLGVGPGTVDGRLRRALDRIRDRAKEAFGEA